MGGLIIQSYNYVFPVVGGAIESLKKEHIFSVNDVFGTAFSIGDNRFLTAGHVIENAVERGSLGVAYTRDNNWVAELAADYHIFPDCDVGVIQARVPRAEALTWKTENLPLLTEVQVAYPYAFDRKRMTIDLRAFKGHVAGNRTLEKFQSQPRVYELSFQCPRGLSGAPLLVAQKQIQVGGIVLGNEATEITVFTDREVVEETGETTIIERYESLQPGIAVESAALTSLTSHICSGSLLDHLSTQNLA